MRSFFMAARDSRVPRSSFETTRTAVGAASNAHRTPPRRSYRWSKVRPRARGLLAARPGPRRAVPPIGTIDAMINVPTVVVVGAGGSAPFGFPHGWDFMTRVANAATSRLAPGLDADGGGDELQRELLRSGRLSIDAFLEHRPQYLTIGKRAIAATLIPFERVEDLHGPHRRPSWYDHLFDRMNAKQSDLTKNKLSIVTFNYDRSIDYYLREAVRNSYGCSANDAIGLLSSTPIVHVHGQLGTLEVRSYRHDTMTPTSIEAAADGIRVVHEAAEDDATFQQARSIVTAATRIYFVGFGFHPTNVARIRPPLGFASHHEIYASGYGFTPEERRRAESLLGHRASFGEPHFDSLQFLRWARSLDD